MKRYSDLFIDFDDTLYDTHGNAILALQELYADFGLHRYFDCPEQFTVPYWETNVELWGLYSRGEIERDYLIVERFRRPLACGTILNEVGERVPFEPTREYCLEVSDHFLDLCACKPGVVEGAHELVAALREKGYRMHICSNGFHEVQYRKLRACGLLNSFDTIILSEDAGANKPSAQFFDYALAQTGAKRESTLMIGDNYQTDILGALHAGLDAMYLDRKGDGIKPEDGVNYVARDLAEVTKLLHAI